MNQAVMKAFNKGEFDNALNILHKYPYQVDFCVKGTRCDTLLLAALIHGREDISKTLLNMGAEPFLNCHTIHGRNVFTCAQSEQQLQVLDHILFHTAHWQEPESICAWQIAMEGAIESALYQNDFTKVFRLLRHRTHDIIDTCLNTGETAIYVALKHENIEVAKKLLNWGADPWAGTCNPFDHNQTELQQNILDDFIKYTGADAAGSPWDELHAFELNFMSH